MKYILPLFLLLSTAAYSQDTSYMFSGFVRISTILNYRGVHKETRFDTVDFKGSFLKIKNTGSGWFFPEPIGEALFTRDKSISLTNDTFHLGYKDSVAPSKLESFAFNDGITGFMVSGPMLPSNAIIDHFFIYFPEVEIDARLRRKGFFGAIRNIFSSRPDTLIRSYVVYIVRKQASYSN